MPLPGEQHAAIQNAFTRQQQYTSFTHDEIAALQCRLDKQLGPEFIQTRDGASGSKFHYIPANKLINLANDIFGFNGWSTSIQNVQVDFVDESTSGKITMGCSIIVRVTLRDGTYHEDIGYGEIKNAASKAMAFEKTKKEAATDALKRAMRNFGNVLGNCLYDKSYLEKIKRVKPAPVQWDEEGLHRPTSTIHVKSGSPVKKELPKQISEPEISEVYLTSERHEEDEFGADDFDELDLATGEPPRSKAVPSAIDGTHAASGPSMKGSAPAGPRPPNHVRQGQHAGNQSIAASRHQARPQSRHQSPAYNQSNGTAAGKVSAQQGHNIGHTGQAMYASNHQQTTSNQAPASHSHNTDSPQTGAPAQNPPVAFYRASAASQINGENAGQHPKDLKTFDPRTPNQMRRTNGIDHSRSGPISRQAVQGMQTAATPAQTGSTTADGVHQTERSMNFVNPQADPNRRVGMPGGGVPSPLSNRSSSFKPPGVTNNKRGAETQSRPALSDVSNVAGLDRADATLKKPRTMTGTSLETENLTNNA